MTIDVFPTLEDLGRPHILLTVIQSAKAGIILIAGGPRSGITTTLVAAAHATKEAGLNPVYLCDDGFNAAPGIDSITINENKSALLSFLTGEARPPVVIFHETYNPAVTSLALRAAEAGSLVIGGLHVNPGEDVIDEFMSSIPPADFTNGRPNSIIRLSMLQELDSSYSFVTKNGANIHKSCTQAREFLKQEGFTRYSMDSGHRFNLNYYIQKVG